MPVTKRARITRTAEATAAAPASRRRLLVLGGVLVLLVAVASAFLLRPDGSQADLRRIERQNVLLVTIDTLRADAPSCYGGPARTPALDHLAAEGVRFDFAHAHTVVTLPSHATILTGQLPFQHGVRDNSGFRLRPDARTLATLLRQAGYATAAFVGAFPVASRFGLNAGFDLYDERFGQGPVSADLEMPERPASAVVPLARDWIAKAGPAPGGGQRPWFVWVHLFDPHAPYRPPAPFDAQYAAHPYYGEIAAADAALAPLLDDVRTSGRPTLVVVTGDHGEGLGEHGEEAHGVFAYESTLRVPLVLAELAADRPAWPLSGRRRAPAGEVSSSPARHIDILPTILDAVGLATPGDLPGRTLLPAAERRPGASPRTTYFEAMSGMLNHGWAPLTGVLLARDKYIDLPIAERYDLATDATERANLVGRLPERDRMLAAALRNLGSTLPGARTSEAPDTAARLRALGYVSGSAPARAHYSEADDPKHLIDLDAAVHKGINAIEEGRPDAAAQILRQVLARRPEMAVAHRYLALLEWQQGHAEAAIRILRQARAAGVSDPKVLGLLGEYLADSGSLEEGIRALEPLAAAPEADTEVLTALAIADARSGRPDEARRLFERASLLAPWSSVPHENLGVLALARNDVPAAKTHFARAIARAPASPRAYAGAGAAALRAGDRSEAYEAWAHAVQLDPADYETLYNLGMNLARDGRLDAARPYLERFLRTAPSAAWGTQRQLVSRILQPAR
jgi:choline-sulfatase